MKKCPICGSAPKYVTTGKLAGIFCERCYEAGHETSVTVSFDHNLAGLCREHIAMALWDRLDFEIQKELSKPYPVNLADLEEGK